MIVERVEQALRALGIVLWQAGLGPLIIRLRANRPRVLLYHSCESAESSFTRDLEVNILPDHFGRQLDFVQRYYNVVSVDQLATRDVPKRAVVISFDDGYRSVLTGAAPELRRRGLPAVVYLVTDVVGNHDIVWVNELNWLLQEAGPEIAAHVASTLGVPAETARPDLVSQVLVHLPSQAIRSLLAELWQLSGRSRSDLIDRLDLYLDWDEIKAMEAEGFSFGNHTCTHPNMTLLASDELAAEVDHASAEVKRYLGHCKSFAYPFGMVNEAVMDAVEGRADYSIMLVGGTNHGFDPKRIARVGTDVTSDAALFAQMEVVEPGKEWLRRSVGRLKGWLRKAAGGRFGKSSSTA